MKAVAKLLGVLVILAWAMNWPTHAKAQSGELKCAPDFTSCQDQCSNNMGLCSENCHNSSGTAVVGSYDFHRP